MTEVRGGGGDVTDGGVAPAIHVRVAVPSDYERVAELTLAAYAQLGFELGPYRGELADVAGRAADAEVLVAVVGGVAFSDAAGSAAFAAPGSAAGEWAGRVLGAVTYVPHRDSRSAEFSDDDAAGMRMLAVDPAAQGRGVGARLVAACVQRAVAAGRARMVLHTTDAMQNAQRMYRRLGFQRAPERDWRPQPHVALLGYQLPIERGEERADE